MKFYFIKLWNYEFIMKILKLAKDSHQLTDLRKYSFLFYFFIVLHSFQNVYLNFLKSTFYFIIGSNINLSFMKISLQWKPSYSVRSQCHQKLLGTFITMQTLTSWTGDSAGQDRIWGEVSSLLVCVDPRPLATFLFLVCYPSCFLSFPSVLPWAGSVDGDHAAWWSKACVLAADGLH